MKQVSRLLQLVILVSLAILQVNIAHAKSNTGPKKTILIIGDSLSMGHGVAVNRVWVNILQQQLDKKKYNYRIVNASIGGDTTLGGLNRLPKALKIHKPAIVILELGGNDGLRGLALNQTRNNIEQMIKIIQVNDIKLLLIGMRLPPNYGPAYTARFKKIYSDMAKKYKLEFLPFMLSGVAGIKAYVQADGIHPNAAAQAHVFTNIWNSLQPIIK